MEHIVLTVGKDKSYTSLNGAMAAAKGYLSSKDPVSVEILLDSGVFPMDTAVVLREGDVKTAASSLTLRGVGREETVLTGCASFSGKDFSPVEDKPYYVYALPEAARGGDGRFPAFRDFYCNGKRATLAASEELSFLPIKKHDEQSRGARRKKPIDENKLYVHEKMLGSITLGVSPVPEFWVRVEWQVFCLHIAEIDRTDRVDGCVALRFPNDEWRGFLMNYCMDLYSRPYWFRNHLSLLTSENEFYYDRENGRIYYIPEKSTALADAICGYPVTENLFTLYGVKNIHFENLTFTGTTSNYVTENAYIADQCGWIHNVHLSNVEQHIFIPNAAVYGENCQTVSFDRCRFSEIGNDAVYFRKYTRGLSVTNSQFYGIGSAAVRVGSPHLRWDERLDAAEHIKIENNVVRGAGLTYTSSAAFYISRAFYVSICHNTICDTCYSAISVGWTWSIQYDPFLENKQLAYVEIAYNFIDNFMYSMRDGGAIYTLGGNAPPDYEPYLNTVHHNYMIVRETTGEALVGYRTIYHDNGSSHWHDYDNVIVGREDNPPSGGFVIGGSRHQLIERTYILDYFLPHPLSVFPPNPERERGSGDVIIRDTYRGIKSKDMPKEAKAIILAAGARTAMASLPYEDVKRTEVTVEVKDAAALTAALSDALSRLQSENDLSLRLSLTGNVYRLDTPTVIKNLHFGKHSRLTLLSEDSATLTGSGDCLFSLNGVCDVTFAGLRFANAKTAISAHCCEGITLSGCAFENIRENALVFTGKSRGITVDGCRFQTVGASALLFPDEEETENVTLTRSVFTEIGYGGVPTPAVRFARISRLSVRQNDFIRLAAEALSLGTGDTPVDWSTDRDYNVLRARILENRIEDFAEKTNGGAISTSGGNRTRHHHEPFNVIENNCLRPGSKTGNGGGDYAVFVHGSGASQWHTRFNVIFPSSENPSASPLCLFAKAPHNAYASWADENYVVSDTEFAFTNLTDEDARLDLHEKMTHFVTADAPEVTDITHRVGCMPRSEGG